MRERSARVQAVLCSLWLQAFAVASPGRASAQAADELEAEDGYVLPVAERALAGAYTQPRAGLPGDLTQGSGRWAKFASGLSSGPGSCSPGQASGRYLYVV